MTIQSVKGRHKLGREGWGHVSTNMVKAHQTLTHGKNTCQNTINHHCWLLNGSSHSFLNCYWVIQPNRQDFQTAPKPSGSKGVAPGGPQCSPQHKCATLVSFCSTHPKPTRPRHSLTWPLKIRNSADLGLMVHRVPSIQPLPPIHCSGIEKCMTSLVGGKGRFPYPAWLLFILSTYYTWLSK